MMKQGVFFHCIMRQYKDEIITWSIKYIIKAVKTETLYNPKTFSEAVKTTHFMVLGIISVILIVVCLVYEYLIWRKTVAA